MKESKVLYKGELFRGGLMTSLDVVEHDYDVIAVTLRKQLPDDTGDYVLDNKYEMFFTNREFEEFFKPFLYNMKERFDNAEPRTNQP
jgi:hypothetical protein